MTIKRISLVFALVPLFSLGGCNQAPKKEASLAKAVSIVTAKCEELARDLKEADALYPLLLSSEDKLQGALKKYQGKLDGLRDLLFVLSDAYKGRKYYFLREIYDFEVSSGEAFCNMWGGYLAEIKEDDEHNFIKSFLEKATEDDKDGVIVISGTDEETEELWRYVRSGERINYLKWVSGGPENHDCLSLVPDGGFLMQSVACTVSGLRYGFLCEVEQ